MIRRYEWNQIPISIPLGNGQTVVVHPPTDEERKKLESGILRQIHEFKGQAHD